MEQRFKEKIGSYSFDFKQNIEKWLKTHNAEITATEKSTNDFLEFISDYPPLVINKNDFQKRTRTKNNIPNYERCCALRLNGERCTRKKRVGNEYCGTHIKGTPHGIVDLQNDTKNTTQKVEVYAQDIQGIVYYIDKNNNVYQAEDIISNKVNPKVIAKYVKNCDHYSIPEFNI